MQLNIPLNYVEKIANEVIVSDAAVSVPLKLTTDVKYFDFV